MRLSPIRKITDTLSKYARAFASAIGVLAGRFSDFEE